AGVVGAVTGDIDGAPPSVKGGARKLRHAGIDAATDRSAIGIIAWRFKQPVTESLTDRRTVDHRPIDHNLSVAKTGPLQEQHPDAASPARPHGLEHPRIGECRRLALALQLKFLTVNATRHTRRQL